MKKQSLVTKLLVTFTVAFSLITISVASILSLWFKNYYFENKKKQLHKESQMIEKSAINHLNVEKYNDEIGLKNVIKFVGTTLDVDILLADNLGYIYMVSDSELESMRYKNLGMRKEVEEGLKEGNSYDTNDLKINYKESYIYLQPIIYDDYYYGVIVMLMPKEVVTKNLTRVLVAIWIVAAFMIAVNAIVIYFFTKKIILKPLLEINTAANRLAKGEVERRVDVRTRDEIGELAESFNIMAESLEKVDKNRKDFISNVSHELRSPITSIKGFIAAILDGVVPKDKEKYYLNIVYDEIRRLARLVNDLLDISSMEAGKFNLNIEEIDINSILRLCLLNSEGNLMEKGMKVDFVYQNDREFVYGDRDRIMQVVTNLIDNAIKYGARDGDIKIKSISKGNKIHISIYNDGIPLSKEQMVKIWDRFYMVDKSRTEKVSTGLGLPIVRLILTQHGEDLWVNSGEENGVTFTFTLTKV